MQYDYRMKGTIATTKDRSTNPGNSEDLVDLLPPMRSAFSRSKHLWYARALPIGIGVYVAALVATLPLPSRAAGLLAVGTVLAQITAFAFRTAALGCYAEAEGIRRRVMLQDGLGIAPSPAQLAKVHERSTGMKTIEATLNRPYYDSDETQGPRRLLDIISQAAFFTGSLARRTWHIFAVIAVLGLVAPMVVVLIAALIRTSESALEITARVVIASMGFWAAGDFAAMPMQFFQLSLTADRLHDQCERLLTDTNPNVTGALLMYTEYNCGVVKSPPIPFRVYEAYRDRLNQAWHERKTAIHHPEIRR
jgi:hypothetical protein